MFEKRHQEVIPQHKFVVRLLKSLGTALIVVSIALAIGVAGYHWIAGLTWIDSLLNASMILAGMGEISDLSTSAAKLFASGYALFSGLVYVSLIAVLLTPIVHRVLHLFHHHKEG